MGFLSLFIPALFIDRHLLVTAVFSLMVVIPECIRFSPGELVLAWHLLLSRVTSGHVTSWIEKWEGETLKKPQRKQLQRVRRVPVTLKESIMFWRLLTTQNSSRASKAEGIRGACYVCSGTPKLITAVSPKPIPLTFWHTCWDWQLLGGPGWTKAQTRG